jgi:hypothetical protein
MASTVPPGREPLCIGTQALRAWLLSASPSGTKAILPSTRLRIILALMGATQGEPWAKLSALRGSSGPYDSSTVFLAARQRLGIVRKPLLE